MHELAAIMWQITSISLLRFFCYFCYIEQPAALWKTGNKCETDILFKSGFDTLYYHNNKLFIGSFFLSSSFCLILASSVLGSQALFQYGTKILTRITGVSFEGHKRPLILGKAAFNWEMFQFLTHLVSFIAFWGTFTFMLPFLFHKVNRIEL